MDSERANKLGIALVMLMVPSYVGLTNSLSYLERRAELSRKRPSPIVVSSNPSLARSENFIDRIVYNTMIKPGRYLAERLSSES